MEELKMLIEMVAELPALAIWVLIGYFVYKVFIVGSVFGIIRLFIMKAHHWLTAPKVREVQLYDMLDEFTITEHIEPLVEQVKRIRGIETRSGFRKSYIHLSDIVWLREAIDEKLERGAD